MVNKGYSSASAMKESAERIKRNTIKNVGQFDNLQTAIGEAIEEHGNESEKFKALMRNEFGPELKKILRTPVILYLGDHDPSGEDMVRDIGTRLKEFGVMWLEVEKVALTIDQVRQYNPPPNPAKVTDPRAGEYIKKFGESSWEVDALPPDVLARLIRRAFDNHVSKPKMAEVKRREETDKTRLRAAVAELSDT
jgi:hypothetical protein